MTHDNGVYILVSPSVKDRNKEEYRVAYLDSNHNIVWDLSRDLTEILDPSLVKSYFDKSTIYTSNIDAKVQASRIARTLDTTNAPVFHVYLSTTYVEWSETAYA